MEVQRHVETSADWAMQNARAAAHMNTGNVPRGGMTRSLEDAVEHGLALGGDSGMLTSLGRDRSGLMNRMGLRSGQRLNATNLAVRTGQMIGIVNSRVDYHDAQLNMHGERLDMHEQAIIQGAHFVADMGNELHGRINDVATAHNSLARGVNALADHAIETDARIGVNEEVSRLMMQRLRDDEVFIGTQLVNHAEAIAGNQDAIEELRDRTAEHQRAVVDTLDGHAQRMNGIAETVHTTDERLTQNITDQVQAHDEHVRVANARVNEAIRQAEIHQLRLDDLEPRLERLEGSLAPLRDAYRAEVDGLRTEFQEKQNLQATEIASLKKTVELLMMIVDGGARE